MKIVINGIHANLRFASAHMIPVTSSAVEYMDTPTMWM